MTDRAFQQCINPDCSTTYGVDEVKVACTKCGSLLDIRYDWDRLPVPRSLSAFETLLIYKLWIATRDAGVQVVQQRHVARRQFRWYLQRHAGDAREPDRGDWRAVIAESRWRLLRSS